MPWDGVRNSWFTLCFPLHWLQPVFLLWMSVLCFYPHLGYFWISALRQKWPGPSAPPQLWGCVGDPQDTCGQTAQLKIQPIIFCLVRLFCTWLCAVAYRRKMFKYSNVTLFSLLFQFEEIFLETRQQYEKLIKGKNLDAWGSVPQKIAPI